ncbi:MAG: PSD1 and planctomycete cytochrome C domain-containing protein [Bacteroidota bacterium]
MKWVLPIAAVFILGLTIGCWPEDAHSGLPDRVDFNYHIRPILSQNCYACHGPDESTREAGLQLDGWENATAPLEDGGYAIVPGKPHKSLLVDRVNSPDPEHQMPPPDSKKRLTAHQIALLERWIDQGAEWKPHWAFILPEQPKLPRALKQESPTPTTVIDHLLEAEYKRLGLHPSSEARPSSLIRRLSYILTGLPPGPEEVQAFVENYSPESYEQAVEAYLSSPHFGERWARHWMDVIRYAESTGHETDDLIGGAWRYRDYLIRAFNEDLPYDQLVLEHLAGDLMESPRYHPETGLNESILGTAFLCMGEAKNFPVSLKQEETERIHTMIDVTSTAFQALTVGCARCHDHKFDPIPTKDYYAMYGMFEGSRISPWPARIHLDFEEKLDHVEEAKQALFRWIEHQSPSPPSPAVHRVSLELDANDHGPQAADSLYRFLGDFRNGSFGDWFSDGWAFGSEAVYEEAIFNRSSRQFQWVENGYASSRRLVPGLFGALRSPNYVMEYDSLLVRARGHKGTIRLIVENYQISKGNQYGGVQHFVDDREWKEYVFDLSLLKGSKAYLECMPGTYHTQNLDLRAEDYIEIEYVVAFNGIRPELSLAKETSQIRIDHSPIQLDAWIRSYDSLSLSVYDSTHFVGLAKGDPVFSPVAVRGNYNHWSEDRVPHGFLSTIQAGPTEFPQDGSGRLAWAQSVVDPENPLTARIMVNRLWHYLFGKGLVETMDNFGVQGKLPSHPQLLDYLALRFIEEGWSMKRMIRYMVMSDAFRRSTQADSLNLAIDAENVYLHHYSVRRLEAEAIRDGVLAISGRLDSSMYGQPIPVDYMPFLTSFKTHKLPPESGPLDGAGRRSVYQMVRRNYINPLMITFDTPVPFETVGQRTVSYTPAQSLSLLNDPFFHQQAQHWAKTMLREESITIENRIQKLYLHAFARKPSDPEMLEALEYLQMIARTYSLSLAGMEQDSRLWADYCHSLFNLKEFIHLL